MLMDLDRIKLIQEVRAKIPLYYSLPIISLFIHFLKLILGRKGKKLEQNTKQSIFPESESHAHKKIRENKPMQSNDENNSMNNGKKSLSAAEYARLMTEVKKELLGNGQSIENSLTILVEKWNPLIDPSAKANLLEDVNALIRDFLRGLKKSFRVKPPSALRIKTLAKELSNKDVLGKIKHKESLIRYIELYMIQHLLPHNIHK
jgi:hypothetical protein